MTTPITASLTQLNYLQLPVSGVDSVRRRFCRQLFRVQKESCPQVSSSENDPAGVFSCLKRVGSELKQLSGEAATIFGQFLSYFLVVHC